MPEDVSPRSYTLSAITPGFPGVSPGKVWRKPLRHTGATGTVVARAKAFAAINCQEETVAEIRIEEKKRGAPWVLILVLLLVAAIIGWWLWSNRTSGDPTIGASRDAVVDSAATTPAPTP